MENMFLELFLSMVAKQIQVLFVELFQGFWGMVIPKNLDTQMFPLNSKGSCYSFWKGSGKCLVDCTGFFCFSCMTRFEGFVFQCYWRLTFSLSDQEEWLQGIKKQMILENDERRFQLLFLIVLKPLCNSNLMSKQPLTSTLSSASIVGRQVLSSRWSQQRSNFSGGNHGSQSCGRNM